jgi:hypothetical protein
MRNDERSAVYVVVRWTMGIAAGLAFCVYAVVLAVMAIPMLPVAIVHTVRKLAGLRTAAPAAQPEMAQTMRLDGVTIQPRERAEAGAC